VQLKALTIMASLICFPNHFNGLPLVGGSEGDEIMTTDALREEISQLFLDTLALETLSTSNRSMILYSLVVLIMDEWHGPNPRKAVVRDCVKGLLAACQDPSDEVAKAALDALSSLAVCFDDLRKIDNSLIALLIYTLSENIINHIKRGKSGVDLQEEVIAGHYYCLLDWVLIGNVQVLAFTCLLDKVLEAVEIGLLGEGDKQDLNKDGNTMPEKRKTRFIGKPKNLGSSIKIKKNGPDLNKPPSHDSNTIRVAAEIFLNYMMVRYNNYPLPEGATEVESVDDDEDDTCLYFIYNNSSVFSFQQRSVVRRQAGDSTEEVNIPRAFVLPTDEILENFVRIVIRDYMGKYTWDCEMKHDFLPMVDPIPAQAEVNNEVSNSQPRVKETSMQSKSNMYSRVPLGIPTFQSGINMSETDMIQETVNYFEEGYSHLVSSGVKFWQNLPDSIRQATRSLELQEQEERLIVENEHRNIRLSEEQPKRDSLPLQPEPPQPISFFQQCRLLLSEMGLLDESQLGRMHVLVQSARLRRSMKELDKINGRELIKIGVIYVKSGQEDQQSILANHKGSRSFTEFVQGLGWSVCNQSKQTPVFI
jgi:hypothetical protein